MTIAILPAIAGVPDELIRALNDRFRQAMQDTATSKQPTLLVGTSNQRMQSDMFKAADQAVGTLFTETDTGLIWQNQAGMGWVQLAVGSGAAQLAYASAGLTLTGSYQAITGATLTLAKAGTYLITGIFGFTMSLALDDNWVMHGRLVADGVAQTQIAQCSAHLGVGFTVELAVVAQQWIYQPTVAGKVVKLEAEKSGGTGSSFTRNPDTCISAVWIGP